jgi:hypothetical protein
MIIVIVTIILSYLICGRTSRLGSPRYGIRGLRSRVLPPTRRPSKSCTDAMNTACAVRKRKRRGKKI